MSFYQYLIYSDFLKKHHSMLGTELSTLYLFLNLTLATSSQRLHYYYNHFTHEENEADRNEVINPKSKSQALAEPRFK